MLILLVIPFSSLAKPSQKEIVAIFMSRATWKDFPPKFINAMALKLKSKKNVLSFVNLCENEGILQNNIVKLVKSADDDENFFLGSVASSLTSYANAMGSKQKFIQAKEALNYALLLRPRLVGAWFSMAAVSYYLKDCKEAVFWADKVFTFKANPKSKDYFERGEADMKSGKAHEYMDDPQMAGAWDEMVKQLKTIKKICSQ